MSGSPVSQFQATNAATQTLLGKRDASLAAMQQQITEREGWEKTAGDSRRLAQIKTNAANARREIAEEQALRTDAANAIAHSTYPAGQVDRDPAVKAALAKLKAHKMATSNAMFGARGTATACQKCQEQLDKITNCNKPFRTKPKVINGKTYQGPMYPVCHIHSVGGSPAWNGLIADGTKTQSEKRVITQVAGGEGDMATVQAWDDQTASLGAMQKTIKPNGTGELSDQMADFKRTNPAKYKELFADNGWTVEQVNMNAGTKKKPLMKNRASFTPRTPGAQPITGQALNDYVKSPDHPERWSETLGPLKRAGEDPAFQRQQLVDYNSRLISAGNKTPTGYAHPINSYVTSEKGAALVLDEDVNRPGHTADDFGKALDGFYADHPKVSRDPSTWGADRQAYEDDILGRYSTGRVMVDSTKRGEDIMGSSLGGGAGSMAFPTAPPPVIPGPK